MLMKLLQFEWRFHSRQTSFFMGVLLCMLFGFMVTGRLGYTGKVHINSPQMVTSVYLFIGLMAPMIIGVLAVGATLRDDINKSIEMVYSSHLKLWQLGSKHGNRRMGVQISL